MLEQERTRLPFFYHVTPRPAVVVFPIKREWIESRCVNLALSILPIHPQPACLSLISHSTLPGTLGSSQTNFPSMLCSFLLCPLVHTVPLTWSALPHYPLLFQNPALVWTPSWSLPWPTTPEDLIFLGTPMVSSLLAFIYCLDDSSVN